MYVYEKPVRRVAWLLGFIDFRELLRDIQPGEELTDDYRTFDGDFAGF